MKVHTLDIDSGDRDPILYPDSGDYTVFLKNPVYNVSKIKLYRLVYTIVNCSYTTGITRLQ